MREQDKQFIQIISAFNMSPYYSKSLQTFLKVNCYEASRIITEYAKKLDNVIVTGVQVILKHRGKVIIGERLGSIGEGTWAFPGGKVNKGEKFVEASAREVYEEVGLSIKSNQLKYLTCTEDIVEDKGLKHFVTHYLIYEFPDSCEEIKPLLMEPTKCKEWRFSTAREILCLPLFPALINLHVKLGTAKFIDLIDKPFSKY